MADAFQESDVVPGQPVCSCALADQGDVAKEGFESATSSRIDEFKRYALPAIKDGRCPKPTMYLLTEQQELDDEVGPYGRSLLWLVSNAFEDQRGTPLLGMKFCFKHEPALRRQFREVIESAPRNTAGAACTSQTHGGFDNDAPAMNAVLTRILGKQPQFPFEPRDLDY